MTKIKVSRILFLAGLSIMIIAGALSGVASPKGASASARQKARHYFLTGAKYSAEGKEAESAELFRKAYEIDSTYAEAAFEHGIRRMGYLDGDLSLPQARENAKTIARKFVRQYPGDFFPAFLYAKVLEDAEELEEAVGVMEILRQYNPSNPDVLPMLMGLYLDIDEPQKAIQALDDYGRMEGEDLEYFIRKAGILVAIKDTVGALNEGKRMVETFPADPGAVAFLARLQNFYEMPDSALSNFRKAEAMAGQNAGGPIKIQMADFYLSQGDSINYDSKTYEALMTDDLDFETKHDLLAYYVKNLIEDDGNRARADKLFGVLLEQYPHEPQLLSLASRYSVLKHEYDRALGEIDYAIDLDHANPQYWEQAISYCFLAEQYERGLEYYRKGKKQIPTIPLSMYAMAGASAMMADDADEALQIYADELSAYFPGQELGQPINMEALRTTLTADGVDLLAGLYQSIGDAYFKKEDKEKAFEYYENSLLFDPDSPLTLNNYAYFLIKDGKDVAPEALEKADEMSRRAVMLAPEQPTYLDTRAWVLFRRGEYKEAKEIQLKALELLGEDPDPEEQAEFFEHLGDILFMNHEPDGALSNWKKALEGDPDNELLRKKVKHKTFFYE